jgi:hypothetical protein
MTVARKPGHRGERGVSRKPLRRESRIASAEPVCSCAFFCACLHTRPRVQRAPGFPCALLFLSSVAIDAKLRRIAPREGGRTSSRCLTFESVFPKARHQRSAGRRARRNSDSAHPPILRYLTVIASPLKSALAISPNCRPDNSSTAPFWLVSTMARAPPPTAMPAPAAP